MQNTSKMETNVGPDYLLKVNINKLKRNSSMIELPKNIGYYSSGKKSRGIEKGFYTRSGIFIGNVKHILNCDLEWPVITEGETWENLGHKRNKIRDLILDKGWDRDYSIHFNASYEVGKRRALANLLKSWKLNTGIAA